MDDTAEVITNPATPAKPGGINIIHFCDSMIVKNLYMFI